MLPEPSPTALHSVFPKAIEDHGTRNNARILHLIRVKIKSPAPEAAAAAWDGFFRREGIVYDPDDIDNWPQFVSDDQLTWHGGLPWLLDQVQSTAELRVIRYLIIEADLPANHDAVLKSYDEAARRVRVDPTSSGFDIVDVLVAQRPAA